MRLFSAIFLLVMTMPLALGRGATASNPKHDINMSRAYVLLDQGAKYGKWEIVGARVVINNSGHYPCRCECGTEKLVHASSIQKGKSTNCGCWEVEKLKARSTKHGASGGDKWTPEYTAWKNLKRRVSNPKSRNFHRYGGRGIKVCARWKDSFSAFVSDVGLRPNAELSIDRVNNDGHYSCGHCEECLKNNWPANYRWATRSEQGMNKCNNIHRKMGVPA